MNSMLLVAKVGSLPLPQGQHCHLHTCSWWVLTLFTIKRSTKWCAVILSLTFSILGSSIPPLSRVSSQGRCNFDVVFCYALLSPIHGKLRLVRFTSPTYYPCGALSPMREDILQDEVE